MEDFCFGCRGTHDKVGILLAQLGTPDAASAQAVRPYLRQFLSDSRVVEMNRLLWWLILNGIILPFRPKRSAALYARIWTEEGSPLLTITKNQTSRLSDLLCKRHGCIEVDFGMRYGRPSIAQAADRLIEKGCSKVLLFPMYPQYSAATTASTYDVLFPHLLKRRFVPTLRVAEPYYDNPHYIGALAAIINESLESISGGVDALVFSYHGMPKAYVDKGDPYCCMCSETSAALACRLSIERNKIFQTFQSRFGREEWLRPYTDESVKQMVNDGVRKIAVACPGFTADCLETLDEMGNELRQEFSSLGGESFHLIPCLNDDSRWIDAMACIIEQEISSWLVTSDLRRERRLLTAGSPLRCPSSKG